MYRKKASELMKHIDFEIADIIALELAYYLAFLFRNYQDGMQFQEIYGRIGVTLAIIDVLVVYIMQCYKHIVQRWRWHELVETIKFVVTVEGSLLIYEYIIGEAVYISRTVFILSAVFGVLFTYMARITLKRVVRIRMSKEENQAKLLLLSTEQRLMTVVPALLDKPYREYKISCIAVPGSRGIEDRIDANVPIIYGKDSLLDYIRLNVVDEVYIDSFVGGELVEEWSRIFLSMGVTVHIGMGFLPSDLPNRFMEKIGNAEVITSTIKTADTIQLQLKRLVDIIGSIVGLVLTGIAVLFVAPAIKLADPGPIFFSQNRVGKNGRIFKIYKFRSMYMDAEERKKELMDRNEMQGFMFKMTNDPRIIGSEKGEGKGIGNFIRKTSIDELPQFWNVLIGDMSLVGIRPPTVDEYEQYDLNHKIRLSMKPGITGLWQTSGRSDITNFDEVLEMDTRYITEWSPLLDVKLLFKTIIVVLNRDGSK